MSSDGLHDIRTSSNIHASSNTLNLSKIPQSNKEPNGFHTNYMCPQGIPIKQTQDNLHLAAKNFHATKSKYPQLSCLLCLLCLIKIVLHYLFKIISCQPHIHPFL